MAINFNLLTYKYKIDIMYHERVKTRNYCKSS